MENKFNKVKWTKKFKALIISLSLAFAVALGGAMTAVGLSLTGGDKLRGGTPAGTVADSSVADVPIGAGMSFEISSADQWAEVVAQESSASGYALAKLTANITASNGSFGSYEEESASNAYFHGAFNVPEGKYIVLDLNGYTIDRRLTSAVEFGSVIINRGTLVVKDTNTSGTKGVITGGNTNAGFVSSADPEVLYGYGGGILTFSNLTVSNVIFKNNTATYCGAISRTVDQNDDQAETEATINIINCEFSDNSAARFGGAMGVCVGTTLNIEGSKFYNNKAVEGGGGAINADNAYITVKNSEFYDNTANNSAGGAIRLAGVIGGKLSVTGSTFKNNTAKQGGAIYVSNSDLEEKVVISNSTFTNNTTTATGGAIELYKQTELSNVTVSGNTAKTRGGGLALYALTEITDCTITDNTVTGGNGGGIWSNSGITIKSTTVSENTAHGSISTSGYTVGRGGGIWIQGGALTIGEEAVKADNKIVKILNNSADVAAGGIYAYSSLTAVNIYNAKIDGNVGVDGESGGGGYCQSQGTFPLVIKGGYITNNKGGYGGGLYVNGGSVSVTDTDVSYNTATDNTGGGFIIKGNSSLTITNVKITHNTSEGSGAGIYMDTGTSGLNINGAEITYNYARSDYGGGVFLNINATATVTAANISYNTATAGAGIYTMANCVLNLNGSLVDGKDSIQINYNKGMSSNGGGLCSNGSATMTYVTFDHNYSGASGGGISAYDFDADHITVTNSEALGSGGGIRLHAGKEYEIRNSTVTGNTSAYTGGGIYQEGNTTLVNVTVTGNNSPIGGGIYASAATTLGGTITVTGNTGVTTSQKNNFTAAMNYPIVPIESGADAFSANSRIGINTALNEGTPSSGQYGAMLINTSNVSVAITSNKTIFSADFNKQVIDTFTPTDGVKLLYIYKQGINAGVGDNAKWVAAATDSSDSNPIQVDFKASWPANKTGSGTTVTSSFGINETGKKGFKDGALHVPAGANIILNLGKYILDRGLSTRTSSVENGSVIIVDGTLTIIGNSGCNITGGYSTNGGGIYVSSTGKLTIINALIDGNKASTHGGGVYVDGGTFTMNGGTIRNNTATKNGGGVGVGNKGTFTMNGGYIGATKAENGTTVRNGNKADCGAGVFNSGSTFIMNYGTIYANVALNAGGGLYAGGKSVNTITDGIIGSSNINAGNTAANGGGGIYLNEGSLTMSGGTILGNQVTNANGGGILAQVNTTVTITGGNIKTNTAFSGAGILLAGGTSTNKATLNLGAKAADGKLSGNVVISGNHATGTNNTANYLGGGIMAGEYTTVNFYGGTVKGNDAKTGGAGIATSGKLNMEGGVISDNTASVVSGTTASIYGAGVYVSSAGTMTMSGGKITKNNASAGGGGIDIDGSFTMTGGEISGNTASTNGGGVFVHNGATFNLGVNNSGTYSGTGKITGNTSTDSNGGGVYVNGDTSAFGTFNLYSGTISGNTAKLKANATSSDYSSGRGGGVFVGIKAKFNMYGGAITENTTGTGVGGGVYATASSSGDSGTVAISGGLINKNTARVGGGVFCAARTTFTMSDGTISENSATQSGGGVYVQSTKTATISGNAIIKGNTSVNCGGVFVDGCTLTMNGGKIDANKATGDGAGVYIYTNGTFNLNEGEICYNDTSLRGGGVYGANTSTFNMHGGKIHHNVAANGIDGVFIFGNTDTENTFFNMDGGEIYGHNAKLSDGAIGLVGIGVISGGKIYDNTATSGGAIGTSGADTSLTIKGSVEIYNNVAAGNIGGPTNKGDGGALYITGGELIIEGGKIYNNKAVRGGGVYIAANGSFTMKGGEISGNTTSEGGAGVYTLGTFEMQDGEISDNTAGYGAGVFVGGGEFTLTSGTISGNSAMSASGGGVSVNNASSVLNINGGEISGNTAIASGAGVFVNNGTVNMSEGEISENIATNYAGGVLISGTGIFNISGGTISGNTSGKIGGGVLISADSTGTIKVSGKPVITGNTGAGINSNVYLQNNQFVTVEGTLNSDADISVSVSVTKRVFTTGLASGGLSHPNVAFSADNKKLVVGLSGNEATLLDCNNINLTVYDKNGEATETTAFIKVDANTKVTYALSADKSKFTFTSTQGARTGVTTVVNVPLVAGYTPYVYDPDDSNAEVASGEGVLESVSADRNLRIGYKANTNTAYTVYYILQAADGSYIQDTTPAQLEGKASVKKYVGSGTTDTALKYLDNDGKALTTFENSQHYSFDKVEEDLNIKGDGTTYVRVYLKLNEYTVSFTAPGATNGMQKKSFKFGSKISDAGLKTPSKDMNTFAGWYYDAACTEANKVNFGTDTVTGDITVYAKFTTKQYKLIFDLNVGTDKEKYQLDTDFVISETAALLVNNKVKWDTASLFPEDDDFDFTEAEGTGRYQISYDVNNVSSPKNLLGIRPSAIGYKFLGWFASATATSQTQTIRKPGSNTADEIVLTARWEAAKYTMHFDYRNGDSADIYEPVNLSLWKDILPDEPTYSGYVFDGWYTTLAAAQDSEHNTDIFTWSSSSEEGNETETAQFSIYDFRVFSVYGNADDGYDFNDLTLYAGWKSVPVRVRAANSAENPLQGKLAFKTSTGVTISATTSVNIGDEITVEITPNDGYKFKSMTVGGRVSTAQVTTKTVMDGQKEVTVSVIKFTVNSRDIVNEGDNLYVVVGATFTEERYTITYDTTGGKSTDSTFARTYSASEMGEESLKRAKLPSLLTKRGYIFAGWVFSTDEGEAAYETTDEMDDETGLYGAALFLKRPYDYATTGYRNITLKAVWTPQVSYVYLYNATYSAGYNKDPNGTGYIIGEENDLLTDMDIEIINPSRGTSFVFQGWATSRNGVVVYPAVNTKNTVTYKINAHKDEKGNLLNRNNLYAVWHIAGVNYIIMSADNNGCTYGGDGITMNAQTARTYDEDEAADIKLNYTWYRIFEGHYDDCFDVKDFVDSDGYKVYVDSTDEVVAYEKDGKYYEPDKTTEITKVQAEDRGSKLTYKEFNATKALAGGFCEVKTFTNPDGSIIKTTGLDPDEKCEVSVRNVKDCGVYVCVVVVSATGEGSTSKTDGYGEIEITMNKAVYDGVDMSDTTVSYNTAPRYDMITIKNAAGKDPTTTGADNVTYLTLPDGSKLIVTYRYYQGTGEARTELTDLNQIKNVGTYHVEVSFAFTPDGDKGNYELLETIDADLIIEPDTIGNLQYEFVHGETKVTDTTKFSGPYDGEEYKVVAKILDTTGIGSNSLVTAIDDVAFDVKVYRISETGDPVEVTEPTTEAGSYYLQIVGLTGNDASNYELGSGLTLRADYSIGKKAYAVAGHISFSDDEVTFDNELHTVSIKLDDGYTIPEDDIKVVYKTSYEAEEEDFTAGRLTNKTPDDNGGRYAGVYTVTVEFEFKTDAAKNNYAALESMSATLTIKKANFFEFYNVDGVDLLRDAGFVNAAYAYQVKTEYHPYITGGMLTDTDNFGLSYEYYRITNETTNEKTLLASGTHAELVAQGDLISLAGKYEIVARIKFVSALYRNNFEEIKDSESTVTYVIRAVDVESVEVIWQNKTDENGEKVIFDKNKKEVSLGTGFDYGWIQQINVVYANDAGTFEVKREADIALAGIKLEQKNNVAQTTFWKVGKFNVIVSFYGTDSAAYEFTVKEKVADVQLQYCTDSDSTYRPVREEGLELVAGVTYSFRIEYKCTNELGVENTTKYSALTYDGALALGSNVLTASEAYYEFDEITVDIYKVIDSVTWQYKLGDGAWTNMPENHQLVYAGAEYKIQAVFEDNGTQTLAAHAAQGLTILNYTEGGYLIQVGRSGNYWVTADCSLDITKLILEVDWDVNDLPYNTWHQSPKAIAKNMKDVDKGLITFDYGFEIDGQPTTSANVINVGEYVVKLILTGDETACSNYTLVGSETASHEFKIVQADIEMTVTYNEHNYGPNVTFRGNPQGLRLNAMKADFGENAVVEGKFAFITNYSAATGKYDIIDGADLVDKISGTTVTSADVRYVYIPDDKNYKDKIATITVAVQSQVARSGAGALSVEFGEDAVQFYLVNQQFDTYGIIVHLLYQSAYEEDGEWYGRRDLIASPNFRIGSMVAQGYTITAQDLSSEKVVLRAISGSNSGTLDVSVVDKVARGLEVSSTDHKTVYYVGEPFDFSDMEFRVTFGPGDAPQEGLKKGSIKADLSGIPDYVNGAFTEAGTKTVTFKYFDVPCPVTFTVKPKEDLQIIRPTNLVLTYRNGEELTAPQLKFSVDGATLGQTELSGVTVRTTVTDKATGATAVLGAKKEGTYNVRYTFTVTNPRFNRPAAIDIEVKVTENPYTVTIDVPTSGLTAPYAKEYISIPKPTVGSVMDTTDGNKAVPESYLEKIYTIKYRGETQRVVMGEEWHALHRGVYEIEIVVNVKPYKGYGEYEAGRASYEFSVTKAENDPANITLTVPSIVLLGNADNFKFKVEADFGAETAVLEYSKTGTGDWKTDKPTEAGRWFVRARIAEETVYGDYTGVTSDVIAFNVRKAGADADMSGEGSIEGSITGSEGVEGDWKFTIKESAIEDVSINKQTALYGYTVSLVDKNGVAVKASGEYTIQIKLSDEQLEALNGKTIKLFRYDAEGKATEVKVEVKDGRAEFKTSELGRFVVTEAIPSAPGAPVGLIVGVSLGAVIAATLIALVIIVFLKKKRGNQ